MQERIPTVLMRGGTSKALFFHENHLPAQTATRDAVLLAAYGSPDPNRRQIDGLGGATSTASKVAIIGPSADPNYDVVYTFGQVSIDQPFIDFRGNCGNISSAVGPFAIDAGLVKAREPVTQVRIFQKNTGKTIIAEIPVRNGQFDEEGEYAISGVPGTAARITLRFTDPGGAVTGALFPTGKQIDYLAMETGEQIPVTIMDASNPVVFVQAATLGLAGTEIEIIDREDALRLRIEAIRGRAAVLIGVATTTEEASRRAQAIPKIAMVAPPQTYKTMNDEIIHASEIDLVARIMSMGSLHRAYAVTGAICTVGAAMIEGTVVNAVLGGKECGKTMLKIGHPSGTIEVGAKVEKHGDSWIYREALVGRTARKLMEGHILIPRKYF